MANSSSITIFSVSQNSPFSYSDSMTSIEGKPPGAPPAANRPSKKPRGRPPGSKNKPKLGPEPAAAAPRHWFVIVNVAPGRDIMECIIEVGQRRGVNVTVVGASGTVASVTFRNSLSETTTTTRTLNGPFTLLSINGTYLCDHQYPPLSFSVNLSTSQGQLYAGPIGGTLIAGHNVHILLCSYTTFEFYPPLQQSQPQL